MTTSPAEISLDALSIDTLRLLAVDTVEKAKSGHPGAPLGCAPIAYLLFNKIMKHNPAHSRWADRDRFVLSNGHASALLYSTLFLSGYKVSLDDLPLSLDIRRAGFQAYQVLLFELKLRSVFDGNDTFGFRDETRENVEQRGLSAAGSSGYEDIEPRLDNSGQ